MPSKPDNVSRPPRGRGKRPTSEVAGRGGVAGMAEGGEPAGRTFTLVRLLQHVGKLFHDRMRDRLDRLGLHPSQGQVLHLLAVRDGVSQLDLTRMMRIAAPTVSGILTRMESTGLIQRRRDADDERVIRVHLTAAGRAMGRDAQAAVDELEQTLIDGLSIRQLRSAHALLRKLRDNLGGRAPGDEPPVSRLPLKATRTPSPRGTQPEGERK